MGHAGPMTAGPPESSSHLDCLGPHRRHELPGKGTREYMTAGCTTHGRVRYKWIVTLLFAFAISLLGATEARAEERCVADLGGVVDGFVTPNPPSQIQIDGNCIIRNFPASNPLRTNFSFYGNNPTSWLVVFDNVIFTGNMSCNLNSQGNRIWFTNGSSSTLKAS